MSRAGRNLGEHLFADLKRTRSASYANHAKAAAEAILSTCFRQQQQYINDPHPRIGLRAPRRSGKTFALTGRTSRGNMLKPRANRCFISLTRTAVERIIWDQLQIMNKDFEMGAKFNSTALTVRWPNGSKLLLAGAETQMDIDKLRGLSLDEVVIDEAGSFHPEHLAKLIKESVGPALKDRRGRLTLAGTPGKILKGEFFEATRDGSKFARRFGQEWSGEKEPRWSSHFWTCQDNVAVPHLWEECLLEKEAYNFSDDNPIWVREYLGQWMPDDSAFVYRYNWGSDGAGKNEWRRLPEEETDNPWGLPPGHEWRFLMGIDFGFTDDFAVQVGAYSPTHPILYQVWEKAAPGLTVGQMAEIMQEAVDLFGDFEAMVADKGALANNLIETFSSEYGFPVLGAEKKEKRDYIELLNADLWEGKVKILANSELARDWQYLVWGKDRKKEAAHCKNHNADAFLYMWRYSQHRHSEERESLPMPGTDKYREAEYQRQIAEVVEFRRRQSAYKNFEAALDNGIESMRWVERAINKGYVQ